MAFLLLALAACGSSGEETDGTGAETAALSEYVRPEPAGQAPPIEELCGTDPVTIAVADSYGQNAWHKITLAEMKDEVAPCDNVTIKYSDAAGDAQTYVSQLNSWVAQGVDGITGTPDVGNQALRALTNATEAGIAVVPYDSDPGGVVGKDYAAFVEYRDRDEMAKIWADWLNERLDGKGKIVFIGGSPGAPSAVETYEALEEALEKYPGISFLEDGPVANDWEPAETQRVVSGLISKYPEIDAIASDYGAAMVGSIRAYENAGEPHPPLATGASSNQLGCMYNQVRAEMPGFEILSLDGSTQSARLAVRKVLAEVNGIPDPEPLVNDVNLFIDTVNDGKAPCEPSLPPDADISSGLSKEQLAALFQ